MEGSPIAAETVLLQAIGFEVLLPKQGPSCIWSLWLWLSQTTTVRFSKALHSLCISYILPWCLCISYIRPWCLCPQRCSDGSLGQREDVEELQQRASRQTSELAQMKDCMAAMSAGFSELEEDLDTARKDLIKSEDVNTRLQRDLREVGTRTQANTEHTHTHTGSL